MIQTRSMTGFNQQTNILNPSVFREGIKYKSAYHCKAETVDCTNLHIYESIKRCDFALSIWYAIACPTRCQNMILLKLCVLPVLCWGDETQTGNGYSTGNQPADVTIQQEGSSEIRALRQGQSTHTTFDTSTPCFRSLCTWQPSTRHWRRSEDCWIKFRWYSCS